jgi:branched-chain amino acid transport system ATP-binding protein
VNGVSNPVALRCADIRVQFGALKAIDGIDYEFERGRVYGLIGPNGAGKTTLLNVLSGRLMRFTGQLQLEGADIGRLTAHQRARRGMGRSFQITKIFPELSVLENLRIAAQAARRGWLPMWPSRSYDRGMAEDIEQMLTLTGLARHRDSEAGTLSYGLQRALELGVTLMPNPSVLMLDEPLAGVGHHEIDSATALIQSALRGRTVLLIEHNMDVVMRLSERVVVMAAGRVIADGTPAQIRDDPLVRSVYLGDDDEHYEGAAAHD